MPANWRYVYRLTILMIYSLGSDVILDTTSMEEHLPAITPSVTESYRSQF